MSLRELGKRANLSHAYVSEMEHEKRPTPEAARALDDALEAGGALNGLVSTDNPESATATATTENTPATKGADVEGLEFALTWQHGIDVVAGLWRDDAHRRYLLQHAQFAAAAYFVPAIRWLTSPLDDRPARGGDRSVGDADVQTIRQITAAYRSLDNQYGGGHIRVSVVRYLDAEVTPLLRGCYSARVGAALMSATAELTQLAAWAAYDDGLHGLAQRYMIQALRLAMTASDRPLGAEILAGMGHQAVYLGAHTEAIDLARAAARVAAEINVAALVAESAVLEAHAHAIAGDETACGKALNRAECALDRADRTADPQWIAYFDEAYLAAKFGHCFAALGRGDLAQRFARRSLQMDSRYVRGKQFNLALLGRAYAQVGEVEQAAEIGVQAVELAQNLRSSRSVDYIADLANRLGACVGVPAVREFAERATPILARAVPGRSRA